MSGTFVSNDSRFPLPFFEYGCSGFTKDLVTNSNCEKRLFKSSSESTRLISLARTREFLQVLTTPASSKRHANLSSARGKIIWGQMK